MDSIDPSLTDAAKIDGATQFKEFWYIVLPMTFSTISLFLVTVEQDNGKPGILIRKQSLRSFRQSEQPGNHLRQSVVGKVTINVVVLRNSSGRRINYGVIVCLLRVQKARYVGDFPLIRKQSLRSFRQSEQPGNHLRQSVVGKVTINRHKHDGGYNGRQKARTVFE